MATTKLMTTKDGRKFYKIAVSRGHGVSPYTTRWYIPEGWSKRSIESGLKRAVSDFEAQCKAGAIFSRAEIKAREAEEAAARANLRTLKNYGESVFMPRLSVACSENTRSSYQSNLNNHIYPALGDLFLEEITTAEIEALLLSLQSGEKPLKYASVIKVYQILSQLFKQAFKGKAALNPMLDVERPKAGKSEAVDDTDFYYSEQEMRYILQCLDIDAARQKTLKWKIFVSLAVDTGARRGELCGIRWREVNFSDNTIRLSANICYTPKAGVYEDTLKSKHVRIVDIDSSVMELLKEYRAEQLKKHKIIPADGFIFTQEDGIKPIHPQSPDRYFKRFGERYNIEDFHPHKLRHSFASIAIQHGADIASVAGKLGHQDTATTLRMYTHSSLESQKHASSIFREALKDPVKKDDSADQKQA